MLDRFLKPRWQHPDLGERRRAVEALADDETEALSTVASGDPAPALRRLALRRLVDLDLIARRAAEDEDAGVREQASRRYRELLCGTAEDAPPLAERLTRLAAAEAAEVIEAVAREGAEAELRRAAVARVQRPQVLRDVVLADPSPELRLAVLERIDDEALLERIAEHSRTSDKHVHHRAREMLDAQREARERPERLRRRRDLICNAAEGLGASDHWLRDRDLLAGMEREWATLAQEDGGAEPALEQRFAAARERFASGLAAFEAAAADALAAREALIEEVETLGAAESAVVSSAPAPVPRDFPQTEAPANAGPAAGPAMPQPEPATGMPDPLNQARVARPEAPTAPSAPATAAQDIPPAPAPVDAGPAVEPAPQKPELGARESGPPTPARDAGTAAPTEPLVPAPSPQGSAPGSATADAGPAAEPAAPESAPRKPDPLKRAREAWTAAPAHPDADIAGILQQRFDAACRRVRDARAARRGATRLKSLRAEGEKLLAKRSRPLRERDVKRLEQQFRDVVGDCDGGEVPGGDEVAQLARRVQRQLDRLRDRLREQLVRRQGLLEGLPGRLDALAAALEQGQAAEAVPLQDAIEEDLATLDAMDAPADRLKPLRRRFGGLAPKVRTMRAWEQFGADQARERLCEEMEALVGSEASPPEIATRVREARARWKDLAPGNPRLSQKLWHRFNDAAGKAYEPCQGWYAERAEERKANLARREEMTAAIAGLADALEADGFDDAAADWKSLAKQRRELERRWREAGPVDRKAAKAQEKAFRAALARLDGHLDRERKRCLREREALIAQVEALHGTDDSRDAIEQCKALQRHWQVTVPLQRKREQALWERFRGACDVLFEQHKEVQSQRRASARAAIEAREALCARLEALLGVDADGLADARREADRLRAEWREAPRAPRREGDGLERRFDELRRRFLGHGRRVEREQSRATLEALRARAALCVEAEVLAAAGAVQEAALEALRGRWELLPDAGVGDDAEAVTERFEQACACAAAGGDAALVDAYGGNRAAREALCLRMEIAAGVDSPPEFAEARMKAQLSRLASAFGDRRHPDGDAEDPADGESIVRRWCVAGPAAPTDAAALEVRFASAYAAWAVREG
jgi:hypothetical protein